MSASLLKTSPRERALPAGRRMRRGEAIARGRRSDALASQVFILSLLK